MEFNEKAKIRIQKWIHHNIEHEKDYEEFAIELEKADLKRSAEFIKEMIEYSKKQTQALKNALKAIEDQ